MRDLLSIIDELSAKGVKVVSQKENFDTSTPQGKLMLTVFAGLAEFEREMILKEALIKSRLTAWHAICLHIFRHITQILLDLRQQACVGFRQSDEKSDCASCAPDLISASLTLSTVIYDRLSLYGTSGHFLSISY